MRYESPWWSIDLPEGALASKLRSECLIQAPTFSGRLRLECLRKEEGEATEDDLKRYAGDGAEAKILGGLHGYYQPASSRWVFTSPKSDKMMIATYHDDTEEPASRPVIEEILKKIELK